MKKLTIHKLVRNKQQGFTLVEMLVVAALIAIFAAIAVFNITEQLQREKVKAATAEARGIATSMSFAYNDMGFFPKLCFLRFSVEELQRHFDQVAPTAETMEYFGWPVEGVRNKLDTNWRQKYLAGTLPEKLIQMELPDGRILDWPKDPFGTPYVAYLVKVNPPGTNPEISWLTGAGEKPNYFAGIVSYGRNRVPGGKDVNPVPADIQNRIPLRLFATPAGKENDPQNREFTLLQRGEYTQARLNQIVIDPTGTGTVPDDPNIREAGSDDRYYEF